MRALASTKGGVYVAQCDTDALSIYPINESPSTWPSCEDAYQLTWSRDPDGHLTGLSDDLRVRMARSMGYCPHRRCQLGTLDNAKEGQCPAGLCYTKLEHGSPSFGACCFVSGTFDTGDIIGFEKHCQRTPKPIYRRNRIVLRGHPVTRQFSSPPTLGNWTYTMAERLRDMTADNSELSFINANEIYPNIIATQCPMRATAQNVQQMLQQENVNLWIQLTHPTQLRGHSVTPSEKSEDCLLLSDALSLPSVQPLLRDELIVEDRTVEHRRLYLPCNQSEPSSQCQSVEMMWFKDWDDFRVPDSAHDQTVLRIAEAASRVVSSGGVVAIACHSGRGRTGTLAAMAIGRLLSLRTAEELVDIIVRMRESRDGLVETPQQFAYALRVLDIPMSGSVSLPASAPNSAPLSRASPVSTLSQSPAESISTLERVAPMIAVLVIAVMIARSFLFRKQRIQDRKSPTAVPKSTLNR